MKKAVFFDLDNTLWVETTGRMPESTKEAMRRLKENGVYIFLCTGRTRGFIRNKKILDLEFDGFVTGCGTHVDFRNA
jgi:hydroxymethylpyrimidine pyrophosphatase-like HAD family hydrolase